MQRRKEGYPFKYHPNAYLERKRNVVRGLNARTKILKVLAMSTAAPTIKAVSKFAAMSYPSSFHHLRLLEEEEIVKREGKRPYKWILTGKGQKGLDEVGLGGMKKKNGRRIVDDSGTGTGIATHLESDVEADDIPPGG